MQEAFNSFIGEEIRKQMSMQGEKINNEGTQIDMIQICVNSQSMELAVAVCRN